MLCVKKNTVDQRHQTSTEFSTLVIPHPPVMVMGLDGAAIERYPKTQLGESGRLPKPNDNICSICLCEYQPKEMLRTIPECNHYFHANCIDGWLKMNATCPLCRNLPQRSISLPSVLPLSPRQEEEQQMIRWNVKFEWEACWFCLGTCWLFVETYFE